MFGQAGQHVTKICKWVEAELLAGRGERIENRGGATARIAAGEKPILVANSQAPSSLPCGIGSVKGSFEFCAKREHSASSTETARRYDKGGQTAGYINVVTGRIELK